MSPSDLEAQAIEAYLRGDDQTSADRWARAMRSHLDRGSPRDAVRCAFWLGLGLVQRGDVAQGSGWLGEVARLADEHDVDALARAYLRAPSALMALGRGEVADALDGFTDALAEARRSGDEELAALGCLGRGQALLRAGRRGDGLACLDEAMVTVTRGQVSPVVVGIVYCGVIETCNRCFDAARAHEWTVALSRWCEAQPDLVAFRGQCLVHRAQVLRRHGGWAEAAAQAREARDRLCDPPHPAEGVAHYELAELHRLRGATHEADVAYHRAHELGAAPHPGLALLLHATGRTDDAAAAIDAALAGAPDPLARAPLLPAAVEIWLAADRPDDARAAAAELDEQARASGAELLAAGADHAIGAVRLASGDARGALERLRSAASRWAAIEVPYELARTRQLIAEACAALGDRETAELERRAARQILHDLGAAEPDGTTGPADHRVPGQPLALSPREQQVLRRVARGLTNRLIADELFLSVKTVERHLSNAFTKLGAANRAEATAIALAHGLLPRD